MGLFLAVGTELIPFRRYIHMRILHWAYCPRCAKYVLFHSQLYHYCLLSGHLQKVLAQTDRDQAILQLLKKLGEVYEFMMQDNTLGRLPSMRSIVG